MSEGNKGTDLPGGEPPTEYTPPAIVWEEPYEPVGFGASCAKTYEIQFCRDVNWQN